jgi:hypothetical protein
LVKVLPAIVSAEDFSPALLPFLCSTHTFNRILASDAVRCEEQAILFHPVTADKRAIVLPSGRDIRLGSLIRT